MLEFIAKEGADCIYKCPDCGKPKLRFNYQKGTGQCVVCEQGYSLKQLLEAGAEEGARGEARFRRPQAPGTYIPAWEDPACRAYLQGRRVGEDLSEEVAALYADDRVHFPVWSPFDRPGMMMSRSILPGEKGWKVFGPGKAAYLFGKLPSDSVVILTEGIFDVLSSGLWGRAIALLGKTATWDMQTWLTNRFSTIIVWLDDDQAGIDGAAKLVEELKGVGESTIWKVVGASELGEASPEEVQDVIGECLK